MYEVRNASHVEQQQQQHEPTAEEGGGRARGWGGGVEVGGGEGGLCMSVNKKSIKNLHTRD